MNITSSQQVILNGMYTLFQEFYECTHNNKDFITQEEVIEFFNDKGINVNKVSRKDFIMISKFVEKFGLDANRREISNANDSMKRRKVNVILQWKKKEMIQPTIIQQFIPPPAEYIIQDGIEKMIQWQLIKIEIPLKQAKTRRIS